MKRPFSRNVYASVNTHLLEVGILADAHLPRGVGHDRVHLLS